MQKYDHSLMIYQGINRLGGDASDHDSIDFLFDAIAGKLVLDKGSDWLGKASVDDVRRELMSSFGK